MAEGARAWLIAWDDARTVVEKYLELDEERVLVLARFGGRGKASGVELDEVHGKGAWLFHIRERTVTKVVQYLDRDHALADLGLATETDNGRSAH
jgi:ketosteroid isomerase-like protein